MLYTECATLEVPVQQENFFKEIAGFCFFQLSPLAKPQISDKIVTKSKMHLVMCEPEYGLGGAIWLYDMLQ